MEQNGSLADDITEAYVLACSHILLVVDTCLARRRLRFLRYCTRTSETIIAASRLVIQCHSAIMLRKEGMALCRVRTRLSDVPLSLIFSNLEMLPAKNQPF